MRLPSLIALAVLSASIASAQYLPYSMVTNLQNLNQFLLGFRATNYAPTSFLCTNNLNSGLGTLNNTLIYMQNPYTMWWEQTFKWTGIVSNQAAGVWFNCLTAAYQGQVYFNLQHAKFPSTTIWLMSFLQNLLGNVINFQMIYDKVQTATNTQNDQELNYQWGRILNLLLIFEPLEEAPLQSQYLPNSLASSEENISLSRYLEGPALKSNKPEVATKQFSFDNFAYIVWGFTNSTIAFSTGNSSLCVTKGLEYYTNTTVTLWNQIKHGDTVPNLIKQTTYLFTNVDPTYRACLWTTDETADAFYKYGFTFEDPQRIIFNIIYHLGNVYDGSFYLTHLVDEADVSDPEWYSVGKDIGFIFYNVFYNQDPPAVVIDWPQD